MIASSSSSPPTRIDCDTTMPPSEITATSLVPAADVNDHRAGRLADRESGADCGGHRLLNQVRLASARTEAGFLNRALLNAGHSGGDANHNARVRPAVLMNLLDEVAEHLLRDLEVGDDAVLEGADG